MSVDFGLILFYPFLGSSPDAIACENGQVGNLEVNYPFAISNFRCARQV